MRIQSLWRFSLISFLIHFLLLEVRKLHFSHALHREICLLYMKLVSEGKIFQNLLFRERHHSGYYFIGVERCKR